MDSFRDLIKEIVDRVEGSVQCLLMGRDGLPVESYPPSDESPFRGEDLGVEYTGILSQLSELHQRAQFGETEELIVRSPNFTALFYFLSEDYFLLLILKPDGNVGKARFLLRINSSKLLPQLV